jgi:hypothetical protein
LHQVSRLRLAIDRAHDRRCVRDLDCDALAGALEEHWKASKIMLRNEGQFDMDALTKAVVLLWQRSHLLERECGNVESRIKAINDVVLHYMREANVEEKLHPVTTAALVTLAKSFESLASDMKSIREEKVTNNEAMIQAFTDLAVDPAAALQ